MALMSTLAHLEDCTYSSIPLSQILNATQSKIVADHSLYAFLGDRGLPWNHETDVRVFRVSMGESGVIPDGIGALSIPFMGCYLLVRDLPAESDLAARFFLLHEIGHSLGDEFAQQSMLRHGIRSLALAAIWSSFQVIWTWRLILPVLGCGLALAMVSRIIGSERRALRLRVELQADRYAVNLMSEDDLAHLRQLAPERLIPRDRDLDQAEHSIRIAEFQRALDGGDLVDYAHVMRTPRRLFWDLFIAGSNTAAWLILLATQFGRLSTGATRRYAAWCCLALVGLAAIRYMSYFVSGFVADWVFSGRLTFSNGRFRYKGGTSSL